MVKSHSEPLRGSGSIVEHKESDISQWRPLLNRSEVHITFYKLIFTYKVSVNRLEIPKS